MNFMKKIDLQFICSVFEGLAIVTFIIGILATLIFSFSSGYYGEFTIIWATLVIGFVYSALGAISFLFLSRIGGAINDIRNKICYPESIVKDETEKTE